MIDIITLFITFAVFLFVGILFKGKPNTFKDYIVANKNFPKSVMLATTIATLLGGGTFIGKSQAIYSYGVIIVFISLFAPIGFMLTGYFISSKLTKYGQCKSVCEVIGVLYSHNARRISAIAVMFFCIGVVGAQTKALSYIIENIFNVPSVTSTYVSVGFIVMYTTFGGIRSVIATDVLQFAIFSIAIPLILSSIIQDNGGIGGVIASIPENKKQLDFANKFFIFNLLGLVFFYLFPVTNASYIQRVLMNNDRQHNKGIMYITAIAYVIALIFVSCITFVAMSQYMEIDAKNALFIVVKDSIHNQIIYKIFGIALISVVVSTADSFMNTGASTVTNDLFFSNKLSDSQKLFIAKSITILIGISSLFLVFSFKGIFEIIMFFSQYESLFIGFPLVIGLIWNLSPRFYYFVVTISVLVQTLLGYFYPEIGNGKFVFSVFTCVIVFLYFYYKGKSKGIIRTLSNLSFIKKIAIDYSRKDILAMSVLGIMVFWQIFGKKNSMPGTNTMSSWDMLSLVMASVFLFFSVFRRKYTNAVCLISVIYCLILFPVHIYFIYYISVPQCIVFAASVVLTLMSVSNYMTLIVFIISGLFFGVLEIISIQNGVYFHNIHHFFYLLISFITISVISAFFLKERQKSIQAAYRKVSDLVDSEQLLDNSDVLYEGNEKKVNLLELDKDIQKYFFKKILYGKIQYAFESEVTEVIAVYLPKHKLHTIIVSIFDMICEANFKQVNIKIYVRQGILFLDFYIANKKIEFLKGGLYLKKSKNNMLMNIKEILSCGMAFDFFVDENQEKITLQIPIKCANGNVFFLDKTENRGKS